jgi:acyl-CoA thioester hydrolase
MRNRFRFWHPVAVRWGDMDAFGHVNSLEYMRYCETARVAYFQELRLWEHVAWPEEGPGLVSITCNYRKQVHWPADLDVGTGITRLGVTSVTIDYAIVHAGTEDVVADGTSVVVLMNYAAARAVPLPPALRQAIAAYEGEGLEGA